MKISKLTPDDPRLTTYALGELDAAERVAIETAIKDDPAAQAAVAQIRALCGDLTTALAKEPLPFVAAPVPLIPTKKTHTPPALEPYEPRKFLRFPFYLAGGLAAAACIGMMFVGQHRENIRKQYQLAEAKASAEQRKMVARELAKLEERNRDVYEIDLRSDGEHVVNMPSSSPKTGFAAPAAPASVVAGLDNTISAVRNEERLKESASGDWGETVLLPPLEVKTEKEGYAAAASLAGSRISKSKGVEKSPPRVAQAAVDEDTIVLGAFSVDSSKEGRKAVARKKQKPGGVRGAALAAPAIPEAPQLQIPAPSDVVFNTEAYDRQTDNAYLDVAGNPLSTFSIDVDTAGYSNMRRFIQRGQRPPRDAVRIEELVNYFPYRYTAPKDDKPFAASMEVADAPWNEHHRLVRIGLKGREIPESDRPALNLVFLLDVSGSMNEPKKLPLVKESMRLLIEKLKPTDRVAITVYAGASGMALASTPVGKKQEILAAIDALTPGGSTNGALGIQLAYDIAKANFITGGANRVVLCTDGDFNVGVTNQGDLTRLIEEKAKCGVFLTVLGFGMGNYKDSTLEKLADKGNGNYGYVDNFAEAKKLLVNQLSGTLVTIAKDVKIQVEFNPAKVKSYRLIGYENRMLKKEDFNNDKIDAGEIGAGHTVTALYEVVPVGVDSPEDVPAVDALKYQSEKKAKLAKDNGSAELLTLKVRYKAPTSDVSSKLEFPLVDNGAQFAAASEDFKFAAAVAGLGMMLRESPHKGETTFDAVLGWAEAGLGEDEDGYRHEFMELVQKAKNISG